MFSRFWKRKEQHNLDHADMMSGCQNAKKIAQRYGYTLTCPEDDLEIKVEVTDENCEKVKKVASKYGFTIVCDEVL